MPSRFVNYKCVAIAGILCFLDACSTTTVLTPENASRSITPKTYWGRADRVIFTTRDKKKYNIGACVVTATYIDSCCSINAKQQETCFSGEAQHPVRFMFSDMTYIEKYEPFMRY